MTRSTNPPSYSPSSQRSRYSQPNLPTLTIPYSTNDRRNDRRMRHSQPTLNSSYSGINLINNRNSPLSYSSLRNSGETSINNLSINDNRLLSTPNVNLYGDLNIYHRNRTDSGASILLSPNRRKSSTSPSRFLFNQGPTKRERLSQPTLFVTGDYYPNKISTQRLSQPCLLSTCNENKIINLTSSPPPAPTIKKNQQKFIPIIPKPTNRERLSQLDFGITKYRLSKDFTESTAIKFNRDRFSIPELETKNDLSAIAGVPKQRFSLDSQLNSDKYKKIRRLLPIASSPISEIQINNNLTNNDFINKKQSDSIDGIIIATATPLLPSTERKYLSPILQSSSSSSAATGEGGSKQKKLSISSVNSFIMRERMSVPEIRNSSLRRLLDPPLRQRHSITGNLRQLSITSNDINYQDCEILTESIIPEITETKDYDCVGGGGKLIVDIEADNLKKLSPDDKSSLPKHIQRHYSYTYDNKNNDIKELIGKLSLSMQKKKYLESNFDENEKVITTVIETETPMLLSSPKYMKKTHVYSTVSDTPKWLKKCLDSDDGKLLRVDNSKKINNEKKSESIIEKSIFRDNKLTKDEKLKKIYDCRDKEKNKNTMIRIKSSGNIGENKYQVSINSNWSETDICRLYGLDCDSDSEDSTSV